MILTIMIAILIIFIYILFWQANLIFAQVLGAPSVYANDKAILDAYKLAGLKAGQTVLDLGCGDGRSLILATKQFGSKGIGVERSLYCWLLANLRVLLSGQRKHIKIHFGNLYMARDLIKEADVIYLYLLERVLEQIEPELFQNRKSKSSIVSLAFQFKKHPPITKKETTNLGRRTYLFLY